MAGRVNQPKPEHVVGAAEIDGPLLVVATDQTVARFAPAWAATHAADRGSYRVLVINDDDPHEVEQIITEATSLGAAGIVAVGIEAVIATATAAGTSLGLPVVAVPVNAVRG